MFKPMKAEHAENLSSLRFPLYVSTKLDGIRAMRQGGQLVSRNLKPIRNYHVQELLSRLPEGVDGELISGNPADKNVFQKTTSAVMSFDAILPITFYAFDLFGDGRFEDRLKELRKALKPFDPLHVKVLSQYKVSNQEELEDLERSFISSGYEGAMLRDLNGPYKQGRSTVREGWLLKLKRFHDSEAKIIGFEQFMHNSNEAVRELSGKLKRSSAKAGLVPMDTLGSLICKDLKTEVEFNCSGFTDEMRSQIWKNQKEYLGATIKYKFFPVGVKDKPRHPIFLGFRPAEDMDSTE